MTFIPAPGMVLVKLLEDDSPTATADGNYKRMGIITTAYDVPMSFKITPGDIICFDDYGYRKFEHEGETFTVVDVANGAFWGTIRHDTKPEPLQEDGIPA